MKGSHNFRRGAARAAILLTSTFSLIACDRIPNSLKRPNMTTLSPRLQPLFEKNKTVCFGRFVLDVPATATVVYGPGGTDGGLIKRYPDESDKLDQHVAAHLGEVEKDREFLDKDDVIKYSLFGKVIEGSTPGQKLVFGSKSHASYSIDSFIPVGKDLFVQSATSAVSKNETVARLNKVASNLRLRAEDELPEEPGICIDGGFLPLQPEFEKIAIGIRLKEFPDVHFSIEVIKNQDYLVESSALEPRLKNAEKDGGSWYSRVKFFRRGPRQLGDWKGFEVLAHKPAQKDNTESHEFHFHSLGALRDPLQPQLDIQLDTGVKDDRTANVEPSLTDAEAVALWDKLTASIRVRPTGGAKQSEAAPAKTPLGSFIDTGSRCPQTGLWQCSEGGEFAGGRRRHFTAGQSMPHAVLLGKPGVWQKLKGERPTHEIATVWQLLEYDSEAAVADPITGTETPLPQGAVVSTTPLADTAKDTDPPGMG